MTPTHAPATSLFTRATLCGQPGDRCGDDLGVTCGVCRMRMLGGGNS